MNGFTTKSKLSKYQLKKFTFVLVLTLLPILTFAGCAIVPVPSKPVVDKKTQTRIVAGETSRHEVLALLGQPHSESDDRRANLYHKDQVVAVFIAGGGYTAAIAPITKASLYLVRYDKKNVVQSAEAANDIADFCYADGICHASKIDLDIMFVSDQRENTAKSFPATSRKCSLVFLDEYRDVNTLANYMANALVRVNGRGIFKARPRASVPPGQANPGKLFEVGSQSEKLTGFFRIDVAPGQHRISYNQPRIGTVPIKPLTLKCNAGDILFVAPRGPKPFGSIKSPTYSFFILPPERGKKVLEKARLYQGQS